MGKLISGSNRQIKGTVGKLIGSSCNGIPNVKGPFKNRTLKMSEREMLNRKKFALAQAWLSPLLDSARVGFRGYSQRAQRFVAAKSWFLKNACIFEESNLRIDPALVKVCSGALRNADDLALTLTENRDLKFTWNPELTGSGSFNLIMILANDVEREYTADRSRQSGNVYLGEWKI
jgi:hypothetical protein